MGFVRFCLAAAAGYAALAFAQADASGTQLQVCSDSVGSTQRVVAAIQRTMPPRARRVLTFAPILCGTANGCCSTASAKQAVEPLSFNAKNWHHLARSARMTVFGRKPRSPFCAKFTTVGGEVLAAANFRLESWPLEERMERIRILMDQLGANRAAEYMSYEATVSNSMPGQMLIPCGTPDSICSCSGEIELHVWEDDPELSQTLAHEATHASLYHKQQPFSHCSSRDRTTDCQNVDRLTGNAEREARLNSRDLQ